MGTWGPGLYANDIAKDLKSTISAVARLPVDASELVEIIASSFPEAAKDACDEDHTTFWLVLADQLHRKGIASQASFDRAIEIIDSGADLAMPAVADFNAAGRKKRNQSLQALRQRISSPVLEKTRKTLREPQSLLMNEGDVFTFPIVETGGCFNPYTVRASYERADWGAALIIACGHAFGYLAHYTPIVINRRMRCLERPTLSQLSQVGWRLARPGTCSKAHFGRMQLEKIGHVALDSQQVRDHLPGMRDGTYAAINDISISNSLYVFSEPRDHDTNIGSFSAIKRS